MAGISFTDTEWPGTMMFDTAHATRFVKVRWKWLQLTWKTKVLTPLILVPEVCSVYSWQQNTEILYVCVSQCFSLHFVLFSSMFVTFYHLRWSRGLRPRRPMEKGRHAISIVYDLYGLNCKTQVVCVMFQQH